MDKPKRPPPVPKFTQSTDKKAELQDKLLQFMSSIKSQTPVVVPSVQSPTKIDVKQKVEQGKKKISLASLNSKLNSMLNAKKINMNTIKNDTDKQKKERQEKIKQTQQFYDPQQPNNYQISQHQYMRVLQSQVDSESQEQQVKQQQKMIDQVDEIEEEIMAEEKQQTALRMMQKFGYKVGEGLGKQGQGIKTPLVVKKTNESTGVIQQSRISMNYLITPEISAKNALAAHNIEIQSVIVLTGIVSLKQLEEGVQEQIRAECKLFGNVEDWINYLWSGQVRIFIKFSTKEEAFKAFTSMNGKYFGQKFVSVRFYSDNQFAKRVLNIPLHQHIPI